MPTTTGDIRTSIPAAPAAAAGGGAVTPDQTQLSLNAYQNTTNRENAFNQTDFVYKTATGPVLHTIAFGTEFGRQTGLSLRNSGIFPNNGNQAFDVVNPFNPTYFGPVIFNHLAIGRQQQVPAQHRVGLCAGSDRTDALAAIVRRRALRQLRSVRRSTRTPTPSANGSTTKFRRARR